VVAVVTGPGVLTRWLRGHRVPRRRLVELLEAERRARLNLPAQVLDLHARIARLESERDDALAEARGAKGALESARRERDHEARVAAEAEAALAAIRRTGYAGPGYAIVRLQPDDGRYTTTSDDPAMSEGRP
jgi:hypothetical protein